MHISITKSVDSKKPKPSSTKIPPQISTHRLPHQQRHPYNNLTSSPSLQQSILSPQTNPIRSSRQRQHTQREQRQHDNLLEKLSQQSSSRQKILQRKINHMLKQQWKKCQQCWQGNKANQIRFINQRKNSENKKCQNQKKKYLDDNTQDNKQNNQKINQEDCPSQSSIKKSQKLTLRNYIEVTPQQFQTEYNNIVQCQTTNYSQSKKSQNNKNDIVLKQVREIKSMFMKIFNDKESGRIRWKEK